MSLINTCSTCGHAQSTALPKDTKGNCLRCQGETLVIEGELTKEEAALEAAEAAKANLGKKRLEANAQEKVRLAKVKELEEKRLLGVQARSAALKEFRTALSKLEKTVTKDVVACDEGPAIQELVGLLRRVADGPG